MAFLQERSGEYWAIVIFALIKPAVAGQWRNVWKASSSHFIFLWQQMAREVYIITFVAVATGLAKWCHLVQWYSANCQWLMSSARKQSSPNIVMPYSSKFITTQHRRQLTWWRKLAQAYAPVCSQCRAYWERWKINEILQKQILQIQSISGKASWIHPSGFSLIPGALNYWRVINWKSAVPDSFLPRTWAGHSETFPANMLRTEGRRVLPSWSEEEGEELTVFTPQHLHTTASSTRRALWVVTAPLCVKKKKNLLTWPLQSVCHQLLTSNLEVLWVHIPSFFFKVP